MADVEMSTCGEDSSSVSLVNTITVECKRLSDDTLHRHHIKVDNFRLSIESIRKVIANQLDIPIVCQVSLSIEGISLDPLPHCFSDFPNRFLRTGEPIHVFLSYYVSSAKLHPINSALDEFNETESDDCEQITGSLNELNSCIFSVGWPSDEAVGTRLHMNSLNFLPKLRSLMEGLILKLKKSFNDLYGENNQMELDQSTITSYLFKKIIPSFGSLTAAVRSLLTFSARWEDKMLVCENKFPELIREIISLGKLYSSSKDQIMIKIGKTVMDYCFRELQLLLSVISVSIQFGTDVEFLNILKDSILNNKAFDKYSNAICLFNLAGTSCVSQVIFSSGIYAEIIQEFSKNTRFQYNDLKSELSFRMVLITMHMLKTPDLNPDSDEIVTNASYLIQSFISNVTSEEIADIQRGGFCFGTLENYVSILYVPSNSIIGRMSADKGFNSQFTSLVQNYYDMCVFVMEVLMLQEAGKRVILAENLLPHFVIADWKISNLMPKVRKHFSSLTHFPFPTLYDIVAIKAVSFGLGDYKEMMHYKF